MKTFLVVVQISLIYSLASAQTWEMVSLFDDYVQEGWYIFSAPRAGTQVTQNSDGTVTVARLGADSQTVYLTHDVSWIEPTDSNAEFFYFTYEFRVRVDQIGGPNSGAPDEHMDRVSLYPLKNRPNGEVDTFSNGRTWLCSFDQTAIGSRYFANPYLPYAEIDFTQFHVITFVCKFDYALYNQKLAEQPNINFGEAFEGDEWPDRALGDHSPWTLYIDRDFANPALVDMPGSGWNGWGTPAVDADGIMQIGFQGNTRGQFTVDYFRTGNGIILDPNEPQDAPSHIIDWELF